MSNEEPIKKDSKNKGKPACKICPSCYSFVYTAVKRCKFCEFNFKGAPDDR